MKINVSNLGAIKQAEFELGELTIICGGNNTGKTYITHAVYGLFDFLKNNNSFSSFHDKKGIEFFYKTKDVETLEKNGVVEICIDDYLDNINEFLSQNSKEFTKSISKVFAGNDEHFTSSNIALSINNCDLKIKFNDYSMTIDSNQERISGKLIDGSLIEFSLSINDKKEISKEKIQWLMETWILDFFSNHILPNVFLSSAERTGASIFQKELDFTRNRLIDVLQTDISIGTQLLGKFSNTYPLAIKKNVDFIREMPTLNGRKSYIAEEHPHILESFADIIGGSYHVSQDGDIRFQPNNSEKPIKLALHESSSAVRSLLDIGFYLRHVAQEGDLLMVDEPELNLHPENQRRVARLFAQLINIGIKVFITTHSDYIIKELNTLIMLNQDGKRIAELAKQEGYAKAELLEADKIKVYIAEKTTDGSNTLVSASIDTQDGIEARSFDTTIEEMNRIQEEIVWGE